MAAFTKDQAIRHVFVLMMENHSFDHLLGFSGLSGSDAATGATTTVNGLNGQESNSYNGMSYPVKQPAGFDMPVDPGHEFKDVLLQLTGQPGYTIGSPYPPVVSNGFVLDYVTSDSPGEGKATSDYGRIMQCFSPSQLPVLSTLAAEFAVCDQWFSSMPGPTWPNRFFVHAASSGGLDHSPSTGEIAEWESSDGIDFANGHIFDRLGKYDTPWRLYRGNRFISDCFPNVAALKRIHSWDVHPIDDFAGDLNADYPWLYTFIEPSYGNILNDSYKGGDSQHPMDDITSGEQLIKSVYEAIRGSALWESSLLIILYDEHGGFYDHVAPPAAPAPGDNIANPASINQYGFDFTQYGVRVPAVVVSPYIPRATIDHRLYDHSSVPATLEQLFDLTPLTRRDANARSLVPLLSLTTPRSDTPAQLPNPVMSGLLQPTHAEMSVQQGSTAPVDKGSLPGFLHAALQSDLEVSGQAERPAILRRFQTIKTQRDAMQYMQEVQQKVGTRPASSSTA